MLAARTNGLWDVLWLGRSQHEHDMRRWFFQCLKQGIKGCIGDLVRLIQNVDFEAVASWAVARAFAQFADFIYPAVGGGINFNYIHRISGANLSAGLAYSARFGDRLIRRTAI